MKEDNIYKLKPYRYPIKPLTHKLYETDVYGFDTETNKKGKLKLLACSNKQHLIYKDLDGLLEFLTMYKFKDTINFFFNLEFDSNVIVGMLPFKQKLELSNINATVYKNYFIEIIPKKKLTIKNIEREYNTNFYDIAQFYQIGSLVKTYEKVFGKQYKKIVDASKENFDIISETHINYCIEDAEYTMHLGKNLVNATNQILNIRAYISPASFSKQLLKSKLKEEYRFIKNPLSYYALKSFNAGRIETIKKGVWDGGIYNYDIRSAYPSIQKDLYKVTNEIETDSEFRKDATHSFYNIDVEINEDMVSPLRYFDKEKNLLLFPNGEFKNHYVAQDELNLLNDMGIDYTINSAVHDVGEKEKPYEFIEELYELRLKYKAETPVNPLERVIKLSLNSLYGVHVERRIKPIIVEVEPENYIENFEDDPRVKVYGDETTGLLYYRFDDTETHAGGFFNPVIASEITAGTRYQLYKDTYKNAENVILYATDCVLSNKKLKLPFGKDLGLYEDSVEHKALVLGNGIYCIEPLNNPEKRKNRFRGFGRIDIEPLVKKNLDTNVISWNKLRPVKLKEARHKNFHELNVFKNYNKKLDMNFDRKRLWDKEPKVFGELYDEVINSKPLTI